MTTDVFFMPTPLQKPPCAIQPDKAGASAPKAFSKQQWPDSDQGNEHETFLTTLRNVSRDGNLREPSHRQPSKSADQIGPTDQPPAGQLEADNDRVDDDTLNDIALLPGNVGAAFSDETQLAANLNQLIPLFEKLGLKISAGMASSLHDAQGAQDHIANTAENILESLAGFKKLVGANASSDLKLDNQIAPGLERLRQLIARIMDAGPAGKGPYGLTEGFNPEKANADGSNGAGIGEGAGGKRQVEIASVLARPASGVDNALKAPEAFKLADNSNAPLSSEGPDKADVAKPNLNMRSGAEATANAGNANAGTMVSDKGLVDGDEGERVAKTSDSKNMGDLGRLLSTAEKGSRSGGESRMEHSLAGESAPVSKLLSDDQVLKERPLKAEFIAGNDAGSKVFKLEAGTNDSGQLASQNQPFEKTLETASLTKEADASSREVRTQTMEQIIRRAVIQVRDGQHEARIDLKPDFLGHVRMQVITANQQVTVKILTEFGFVKDMIENSIQQLKAELQQQGLEVDKVDVSVSRDSQGNKHPQENAGHAGSRQRGAESKHRDKEHEGQPEPHKRSSLRADGHATVDYFA